MATLFVLGSGGNMRSVEDGDGGIGGNGGID